MFLVFVELVKKCIGLRLKRENLAEEKDLVVLCRYRIGDQTNEKQDRENRK